MPHNGVQRLLKHAFRIYIQTTGCFTHYFLQLLFRFFANLFHHLIHPVVQFLLQLLGSCFQGFLLTGLFVGAIIRYRIGGTGGRFSGFPFCLQCRIFLGFFTCLAFV